MLSFMYTLQKRKVRQKQIEGGMVIMSRRRIALILVCALLPVSGAEFTMKQCIDYALNNSSSVKNAISDQAIARMKVTEHIGSALPQVSVSGSLDDNLAVATQLMPGALMGSSESIPVKMGTEYNMSTYATLNQKIYDPSFLVALKAAKVGIAQTDLQVKQSKEQTAYACGKIYYQAVIQQKQCWILTTIRDAESEQLKATEIRYQSGSAKKLDVDKMRVSYNNAVSQVQQAELNFNQILNSLKYQIRMPLDSVLTLADTVLDIASNASDAFAQDSAIYNNRTDYRLLNVGLKLNELNKSHTLSGYLPSLSLNLKYGYQSMPDRLAFTDKWYGSSSVGLNLTVPVFDGFQKHSRAAQSRYEICKAKENIASARQSIRVDIANNALRYRTALDNIENEKANMTLAQSVYDNTRLSYQQGASSSVELLQAESALREAQNSYFGKLLTLCCARLDLEQAKGNLLSYLELNQ